MSVAPNPLVDLPPPEISLPQAPLVRVIAQVRFPVIASIEQRAFIAAFQEALRPMYPVLRPEMAQGFLVGPQGIAPAPAQTIWRFNDLAGHWRVSLAPDFLALETTAYSSRDDFVARLQTALDALHRHIGPQLADRLGLRYIDRVLLSAEEDCGGLVRCEIKGLFATPLARYTRQALSESLFVLPEAGAQFVARWGQLPPRGTIDPGALEPVDSASWILDLDMFSQEPRPFDTEALVAEARRYAERIYTMFRWVVTDEFLRRYGGEL
ncbi:MAG: TIGR04255 family protein [Candidatus Tectimicrobiota bacterium]